MFGFQTLGSGSLNTVEKHTFNTTHTGNQTCKVCSVFIRHVLICRTNFNGLYSTGNQVLFRHSKVTYHSMICQEPVSDYPLQSGCLYTAGTHLYIYTHNSQQCFHSHVHIHHYLPYTHLYLQLYTHLSSYPVN